MKSIHMFGLLVAAGAFGAVAGGAVGALSQPVDDGANSVVLDRLNEIARSVDTLRTSANDARNDVADVRERLVAVELELSRRASMPTPVVRAGDTDIVAAGGPDALPEAVREALSRRTFELKDRLIAAESATAAASAFQQEFAKGMKIRSMPEDERWEYAAETLGLNSVQVDELKAAHSELQDGLKEAVVEETNDTEAGVMTFRRVDGNKMREVRNAFQARVDNALNDDQKRAWKDEGFGHALGRRGGMATFRIRGSSPVRLDPAAIDATGTIDIVTTESVETSDD